MPAPSHNPRLRGALEVMIRLAGPSLDLALAAGERISRVLARDDPGYALVRMEDTGRSAPRSLPRQREAA